MEVDVYEQISTYQHQRGGEMEILAQKITREKWDNQEK